MKKATLQFLNFIKENVKWVDRILLLLLFLLGFNFLSTNKYLIIILALVLFIKQLSISISLKKPSKFFYMVVLFSSSYALFYGIFYSFDISIIKHLLVPVTFFVLTYGKEPNEVFKYLFCYSMGLLSSAFLNIGRTISETGFTLQTDQRIYLYFFTGNSISATLFSLFSDISFAIAVVVLIHKKDKNKKWYHYSFAIISLFMCIHGLILLKNRSFVVVSILVLLLFLFLHSKKKIIPLSVLILLLVGYFIINFNVFDIAAKLYQIPFFSRFISGGSNSNRLKIYELFFQSFWKYPFGGMAGSSDFSHNFVHNVFLDVYSMAGIFPFLSFMCISVLLIFFAAKAIKNRPSFCEYVIIMSLFSMLLLFLFEPVLQADYYYFSLTFLFFGYFTRYNQPQPINKHYFEINI